MKTIKTLSSRIAALLLVVTVGITALPPAAVSMAAVPAAREARAGLVLPGAAASVEAALAVWAAAPVLAEPGAAAAASAAWAAAAATAAEPDADADADSITKKAPCFEQKHGAFCFISAGYCP